VTAAIIAKLGKSCPFTFGC